MRSGGGIPSMPERAIVDVSGTRACPKRQIYTTFGRSFFICRTNMYVKIGIDGNRVPCKTN